MSNSNLRKEYLDYFVDRGHRIIPTAPIIPKTDSTTLFNSAGMQPILPFLLGQEHPLGRRLTDSQICFRAEDIEEIGDNRHSTFFEMLGNWSLGDYFKQEQLSWFFDFLTSVVGLEPKNLYVTVFAGDKGNRIERDNEAVAIWQNLFKGKGIEAKDIELTSPDNAAKTGMSDGRIFYFDSSKNWWSRSGKPENMPVGEPGGPDSEVFYRFPGVKHNESFGKYCHPNCDCGQFLEIGNSVFMEYEKLANGSFGKLKQKNIDFGGGLIRILSAQNNNPDIYQTGLLWPTISEIVKLSGLEYAGDNKVPMRIIADHITAATFITSEGLEPSNKMQGYILRRLVRRAVTMAHQLGIYENFLTKIIDTVLGIYSEPYPLLAENRKNINSILAKEENKFRNTLKNGLATFKKMVKDNARINGHKLFDLYQSYGFPIELSLEIAKQENILISSKSLTEFENLMTQHQNLSRQTSAGMFKGGLADSSEQVVRYHTATHLLNAALRLVLGSEIWQKGSNITAERLRFDFSYPGKLTPEQIKEVENIVNEQIAKDLTVTCQTTTPDQAKKMGAIGVFGEKYKSEVKVYTIGSDDNFFSREICGGPHVDKTGDLEGKFKIIKEESVGSGVRRIKATLV